LSSRLNLTGFAEEIRQIMAGHGPMERRVESDDAKTHYLVRLSPYRDGSGSIEGVVLTFIDITNITQAEARQRVLIDELQHRTRNLLTVVQSIAHRTLGKSEPSEAFSSRLAALGRVQSLISVAQSDTVDIGDLIRLELDAVGAPEGDRVRVSGPAVSLSFDVVQTVALAVHELATNAIKHGALGTATGSLAISWTLVSRPADEPVLIVDWKEAGVSIPKAPERKGFGSELIERALTSSLRAKTEMTFAPDGLICHIELPLSTRATSSR
jgi:two-component system CheB/CheR fusion protein